MWGSSGFLDAAGESFERLQAEIEKPGGNPGFFME
jgi:hypothetical protein